MKILKMTAAVALTSTMATIAACGGGGSQQNTSSGDVGQPASTAAQPAPHHSKLAGAVVGGVVGHELGGHAVAGAAAGALIQHHRNKKAR